MRTAVWVAFVCTIAGSCDGQELWRVGAFDDSYDEFACARNYPGFRETFPDDVMYRVGASGPGADWSFVHPGPADSWAGAREHPFTIEFDLDEAPTAPLRLVVDLVDVQSVVPTSVVISVNDADGTFRLKAGKGDASLADPTQGAEQVVSVVLPSSLFETGINRVVLTSTGSWLLYDAVSLSVAGGGEDVEPRIRSVALEPTVLAKRLPDGSLGQIVVARLEVEGPVDAITLSIRAGGRSSEVRVRPGIVFGTIEHELLVPAVTHETPLTVRAAAGDSTAEARASLKPERHWRIFLTPSVHTDIGYTDLQPRVIERHNENTDLAIELCNRFPAFGWNLEAAWQADIYRHNRSRAECERLYEAARGGQIGVQASYLNMLTGLCSHEELNRWLYHAHSLKRRYDVPFESALITDVPTQVWSVPSTLAAAGIRYYATGINNTRGYTFRNLQTGTPYWWEGPDGSRVLAYFSAGYAQSGRILQSVDDLRQWVMGATRDRDDFPYDALFLYGAFGDNQPLAESIADTTQAWADQYEYPKVVVGPVAAYFKYMEKTYGGQIPVVRGDAGVYWEDGAGSTARETAINRLAHEAASRADALFALSHAAGGPRFPETRLNKLWRNVLLFDEHTWGAWCSISQPDHPQTTGQWEIKANFAHQAQRQAQELVSEGLSRLASLVETDAEAVLVFNATSWDCENKLTTARLPRGRIPADPRTREPLPAVRFAEEGEEDLVHFRVPRVPAWGYAVFPLVPGEPPEPERRDLGTAGPVLENQFYRIAMDTGTGGITSLVDKQSGRQLVDQQAGRGLNQYMYVSGGDGTSIVDMGANKPAELTVHDPVVEHWFTARFPGLFRSVSFHAKCENTPSLWTTVTLHDDVQRVEMHNVVSRQGERKKEAVYFAFPFTMHEPEIRLEIPNGVMRPEIDQVPGACKDWYAVQHWARLTDADGSIAWASPSAPLVCVGDINRGLWQDELDVRNGHLYSYVMNNYWFTNYKADQSGDFVFDYSLTMHAASDAEAARFGWQASMSLRCQVIPGAQRGPLPAASASLCRVAPETVVVTAIKPPNVGAGLIVRLFSYADKPVRARLKIGLPRVRSATLCNLVEEPIEELPVHGNRVTVRIRPQAPTTVRLR